MKHPLEHYIDLVENDGLNELRRKFVREGADYRKEDDTILTIITDPYNNVIREDRESFAGYLRTHLFFIKSKTVEQVNSYLLSLTLEEEAIYVKSLLRKIDQLISNIEQNLFDMDEALVVNKELVQLKKLLNNIRKARSKAEFQYPETFKYNLLSKATSEVDKYLRKELETKAIERLEDFADTLLKEELVLYSTLDSKSRRLVINDIIALFTGGKRKNSVIWTGGKGGLHVLIEELLNQNLIEVVPNQGHWQVATTCFIDIEGKQFSREQLRSAKPPKDINRIIKSIAQLHSLHL